MAKLLQFPREKILKARIKRSPAMQQFLTALAEAPAKALIALPERLSSDEWEIVREFQEVLERRYPG